MHLPTTDALSAKSKSGSDTVNAEQLAVWLEKRLPQNSGLNLNASRTRVRHILNWGGFVNRSFCVDDGSVRYHLKITNDSDAGRLKRWHKIQDVLTQRYRAPEVVGWLEFPEIGFSGLLQQHIDGRTANFRGNPVLLEQLIELSHRLHQDGDLRDYLNTFPAKTYLGHFVETYIDRFNADLQMIVEGQLPFISPALLKWMHEETDRLRAAADFEPAFHEPAIEPVHGDLHENNVLVTTNHWFVLDWDDLALGDPAIDFAVLAWPIVSRRGDWRDLPIPCTDTDFQKRVDVCFRAQLLDEVIDPLADYIAAGEVPSRQTEVQHAKRRQHDEALEQYRTLFGVARMTSEHDAKLESIHIRAQCKIEG